MPKHMHFHQYTSSGCHLGMMMSYDATVMHSPNLRFFGAFNPITLLFFYSIPLSFFSTVEIIQMLCSNVANVFLVGFAFFFRTKVILIIKCVRRT